MQCKGNISHLLTISNCTNCTVYAEDTTGISAPSTGASAPTTGASAPATGASAPTLGASTPSGGGFNNGNFMNC
jgi:hypothetical protein